MFGLLILLLIAFVLGMFLLTVVMLWGSMHPPRTGPGTALARGLPADPGDLGLHAEQWWLDRPDGARLPVWEIATDAQPTTDGLTAVFVHGWAMSRYDMLGRLDPYRQFCERIVLYDLRGHGDATGAPSRIGHDEQYDLLELLNRLGDTRLVLVGLSMGAVIALHAAAEADDAMKNRIAGIVAYGPYTKLHESLRGRLRVQQMPTRPMTDLMMLLLRAIGIRHRDLITHVRNVRCPLLVVHGRNDRISPLRHAEEIVDAAADAALHEIADAEHLDAPFAAAHQHNAVVRSFLQRIKSSPPAEVTRSGTF